VFIIFLKSIFIFLLICTFIFLFVDYRKLTKNFKKYLSSIKALIGLIKKDSKKIDINLLQGKLDDITQNGLNLLIKIISISFPFIISLFLYRLIGLNLSLSIAISSLQYFILLFK